MTNSIIIIIIIIIINYMLELQVFDGMYTSFSIVLHSIRINNHYRFQYTTQTTTTTTATTTIHDEKGKTIVSLDGNHHR